MNLETIATPLLDLLAKSTLLILLGTTLLAALRKSSAANRHAIWIAVFAALALLPVTKLIPPLWSLPLASPNMPDVRVHLDLGAAETPEPVAARKASSPASPSPLSLNLFSATTGCALWLAGVMLLLARRGLIVLRLRHLMAGSVEIKDMRLRNQVNDLMSGTGIRSLVRLSAQCQVPLVAGILRPTVLLPLEAESWTPAQVEAAMRHELGHVHRRDCLSRLVADILCACYWPNPLIWPAARQLRLAQEQACDDLVLTSGVRAHEYAEQLVEAARSLQGDPFVAQHAMAMAQPSTLESRVRAIVDPNCSRNPGSASGRLLGASFLIIALALGAAAQVWGEGTSMPKKAATEAQVHITTRFVEITGEPAQLPALLKESKSTKAPLNNIEARDLMSKLTSTKGVDLLSSPSVVTRSGQTAKIEVIRQFSYPEGRKGKDVGVKCEVTPVVNKDKTIALHILPEVTEFEGFLDVEQSPPELVRRNADGSVIVTLGHGATMTDGYIETSLSDGQNADSKSLKIAAAALPKVSADGHHRVPMFSSRKVNAHVTLLSNQTILLVGGTREDVQTEEDRVPVLGSLPLIGKLFRSTQENVIRRRLYILVTASLIEPKDGATNKP